ncbi:hypothetical protein LPB72_04570 [Hydrogenophaga crassostreae]|uniref:DUF4136 domain-containing protein n=2 Tax=Hydrogenophaga crassostreae TaxID=1763535 RepID=A0A162PAG9_9BURK|nr:hypothetical protein LPB072_19980 [Hydrogenophaga crassostreae]OAD43145.1 hypothetical protein LPB72_04570 [Hydrogenophaga crassostreae]
MVIVAAGSLAGCASVYRVDNQVESFARWTDGVATTVAATSVPAPPQTYRFERLPSQSTGSAAQSADRLEQLVQEALKPLGWTLPADHATAAPWTVEVTTQTTRLPRAPWEDPWERARFSWTGQVHIGIGHGSVMWSPWMLRPELPYYQRQVSLVVREAATGRVAYETSAAHDGRWNSTPALWGAMVSAALEGFPAPPKGPRQVNLDVPR